MHEIPNYKGRMREAWEDMGSHGRTRELMKKHGKSWEYMGSHKKTRKFLREQRSRRRRWEVMRGQ